MEHSARQSLVWIRGLSCINSVHRTTRSHGQEIELTCIDREEMTSGIILLIQLDTYLERGRNKSELINGITIVVWGGGGGECDPNALETTH
jgi:hypothetical protein